MALEVNALRRQFKFKRNNKEILLPDPNPEMSTNEILKFYAGTYPELTNGFIEGPAVSKDKAVYTITTKAGQLG